MELEEVQEEELFDLLAISSPAGSLVDRQSHVQMDPADLVAVGALISAVRTAATAFNVDRYWPGILDLIDLILDKAGARQL
ncbi:MULTISPECIES: hypothetical protein [Streptomyces]|uniref:hypothetical protein n=1 Tax=Streptomyces TaxID=1883 RepID=UPI001C300B81|nr:hypothetical protein [Streptomyces sp. GbtcB7]